MQVDQGTWPEFVDQDGMGSDTGGGRSCAKARMAFAKSLARTKISNRNIGLFVVVLRFVGIYALFEDSSPKKCFLGSETVFLGKKCTITSYISHSILKHCQRHN